MRHCTAMKWAKIFRLTPMASPSLPPHLAAESILTSLRKFHKKPRRKLRLMHEEVIKFSTVWKQIRLIALSSMGSCPALEKRLAPLSRVARAHQLEPSQKASWATCMVSSCLKPLSPPINTQVTLARYHNMSRQFSMRLSGGYAVTTWYRKANRCL